MSKYFYIDTSLSGVAMAYTHGPVSGVGPNLPEKFLLNSDPMTKAALLQEYYEQLLAQNIPSHIVVSVGPGSFTGIRIGLAFVQGLLQGQNSGESPIQVAGVSSLACAVAWRKKEAHQVQDSIVYCWPNTNTHAFCAVLGAGQTEVETFLCDFSQDEPWQALANKDAIWYCPQEWPGIKTFATRNTLKRTDLNIRSLLQDGMRGMMVESALDNLRFQNVAPTALYLRASTAEEKIASKP